MPTPVSITEIAWPAPLRRPVCCFDDVQPQDSAVRHGLNRIGNQIQEYLAQLHGKTGHIAGA